MVIRHSDGKNKMKYGMPYKGSKNKLAGQIFELFPRKKNFYDLFCGGCAMTHYGLLHGGFENYYMNDINPACPELFMDAVHGKFKDEKRWISREDFFRLKDSEPYVEFCWSFGNTLREYMYGKEIELYKKALHYAIFFDDYSLIKNFFQNDFSFLKKIKNPSEKRLVLQRFMLNKKIGYNTPLESSVKDSCLLQSGARLDNLNLLSELNKFEDKLEITVGSYEQVEILPDSVIYCDIPYEGTDGYLTEFDFVKFYSWCEKQTEPLFISSYKMPADRFVCVAMFKHRCTLSATENIEVTEKVFIPKHQEKEYHLPGSLFNFDELM